MRQMNSHSPGLAAGHDPVDQPMRRGARRGYIRRTEQASQQAPQMPAANRRFRAREGVVRRFWRDLVERERAVSNPPWAAGAFLAASLIFSMTWGGHATSLGNSISALGNGALAGLGLATDRISVVGRERASMPEILSAIGLVKGDSIAGFDTDNARVRLEQIGWIESANVRRLLPDRIVVEVKERQPFAVWQSDGTFKVVDRTGVWLNGLHPENFTFLPHVVGPGAEDRVTDLIGVLDQFPVLKSRIRASIFVAGRRWNLKFDNGTMVMLPEGDMTAAITELKALENEHGILSRDVRQIDFRLPDRITMRLSDEAIERRKAGFKASNKSKRKKG